VNGREDATVDTGGGGEGRVGGGGGGEGLLRPTVVYEVGPRKSPKLRILGYASPGKQFLAPLIATTQGAGGASR